MVAEQQVDMGYVISELTSRVRALENKYNLLGERLLIVNQNMIEEYKKLIKEIRAINSDIRDTKKELFMVQDVVKNVVKEIGIFARKEDIKVLEKYIDLWNPLSFVREEEVIKLINESKKGGKIAATGN